jgi:hypothetical protein
MGRETDRTILHVSIANVDRDKQHPTRRACSRAADRPGTPRTLVPPAQERCPIPQHLRTAKITRVTTSVGVTTAEQLLKLELPWAHIARFLVEEYGITYREARLAVFTAHLRNLATV